MVRKVQDKNFRMIKKFKEKYPDYHKPTSKQSDTYNNIIIESMGGRGDNDFEKEEKFLIEKYGMKVFSTSEVRRKGPENIVRSVVRYLADCTDIYISFDVDCLDAGITKGTGTPVENGLREREAEDLVSKFMQMRKVCCFEITEVNPTLDRENLMAEIAFNILQRSVNILLMN